MNFRGQEKKQQTPGQLGNNPNIDATDDYIVNLQQQIHFMELELKILREKVIEDEQKSGIGSLYDDDKTSHQHISLLKNKYAQMRRDFDRTLQDLAKQSLKVKGQEFVLDAQLKIIKEQTQRLKQNEQNFAEKTREEQGQLNFTNKENTKNQMNLEGDIRDLTTNAERNEQTHFEHKLHQDKEIAFDGEDKHRHDLEVNLVTTLKTRKEEEEKGLDADLEKIENDFLAKTDYQNALKETAELR